MIEIDAAWRAANPLPVPEGEVSKNSRGRVLAVGGSRRVPGAIRLTGEAALRAGAGKVRIATMEPAAGAIGVHFPEAGIVVLPERDGELAVDRATLIEGANYADAVVIGPGMADKAAAARLVACLADEPAPDTRLVLDGAAAACAGPLCALLRGYADRLVLTPHPGEMAGLLDRDVAAVNRDPAAAAQEAAGRFRAVVALKAAQTVIAAPDGTLLHYPGGGSGLATGGSGDVLAGIVGGLLARGATPLIATAWAVWLHGEAGRLLAGKVGPLGFLARELLPEVPRLMPR